mgnify:CR=1 FL=1
MANEWHTEQRVKRGEFEVVEEEEEEAKQTINCVS